MTGSPARPHHQSSQLERTWHHVAAEFGPQLARRSARSLRARVHLLRSRWFFIFQCAISAAIAWYIAGTLVGNEQPFFAPIATLIALGQSFGQRLERAIQVVIGVAIGVLVGDLFIHAFGSGYVQLTVIIVIAMSIATLLDTGVLATTQAGVQAIFVTLLVAPSGMAFSRWSDAAIGGAVALAAATITPASPLCKPRRHAAVITRDIAQVLHEAAAALRHRNIDEGTAALDRARASEKELATLQSLADDGLAVVRSSPFRRSHLPAVQAIADLLVPLDRAVRNIRVLVRRACTAIRESEDVPKAYIDLVDDLAAITDSMADELAQRHLPTQARADLRELAERTIYVTAHPNLSGEVIRAQVRSAIVDLLMVTGLDNEAALAYIPASYSLEPDDPDTGSHKDLPTQTLHRLGEERVDEG